MGWEILYFKWIKHEVSAIFEYILLVITICGIIFTDLNMWLWN